MDKEEIKLSDWYRILFGEAPVEFLIEVFFRTLVIFVLLLIMLRLMGKRMAGKITITEMAVMLSIGAIISVPMQIPNRGILVGVMALACALAFQRGYNLLAFKSHRVEKGTQGSMDIVVEDGLILLDKLKKNRISVNQLLSSLRMKKVTNLGSIERVYMEAGGSFSIFQSNQPKPGLPLLPDFEKTSDFLEVKAGWQSCATCGFTREIKKEECPNCHLDKWMHTVGE
jgi:uncharacterized membrane protein YcaP (DUF421 family)